MTGLTAALDPALAAGVPLSVGEVVDLFTSPTEFASVFVEGLAKASLYLMIASGLTLIFGLMDVINFAHGAFTMYGAYIAGTAVLALGVGSMGLVGSVATFLLILVGVFVLLAVLGVVFEVALIRRLYEYPPIYMILLTFGVSITMEELMRMLVDYYNVNSGREAIDWSIPRDETIPESLDGTFNLLGVSIGGLHPFQILLGILTVAGIWYFLNETRYGLFVRAGVEDDEMARALGININRTFTVVFAIGSGLAGAAGVMLMWSPLWRVNVPLALGVLLPAFVIVIVGGLGSFKGTVVASLLVGMLDALATWAFRVEVVTFTDIDQLLIFAILVVMLILQPRGLFGVEGQGDHG
ncbi:amino acid/amide ABC transporter membrane protein 1, HAAT family [Halovenus aranensis]|jgi:branched-chain amino acid transport system permease protein|uniref:Amino acid/amide ABC transporter membrane protein 1, HAAT family n=1 Tax=Halovenus aranensis TaxID=890420 RepID=A0A1G8X2R1_9EURY|nr:branched-chain amino acid ABC transporter permease [Halovenus aranensis]SDJ84892.1 amino acid/amide ABC transporter membrane protein 1, HAAT family [Halovenus aranensis]